MLVLLFRGDVGYDVGGVVVGYLDQSDLVLPDKFIFLQAVEYQIIHVSECIGIRVTETDQCRAGATPGRSVKDSLPTSDVQL